MRCSRLVVHGAACLLAACAPAPYRWSDAREEAKKSSSARAPAMIQPARVVAVPEDSIVPLSRDPADGARRLIIAGMRVVDRPDGSLERARQMLPPGLTPRSLDLPGRLGGGHLFWVQSSGSTWVWRAASWTGDLEPLANVPFDAERIVAGFDRLYLVPRDASDLVAIDAASGAVVDAGALPDSPGWGGMAFADGWIGAVEADYRGLLVTFDAGASWRRLPLAVIPNGVEVDAGAIVLSTYQGRFRLAGDGRLQPYVASVPPAEAPVAMPMPIPVPAPPPAAPPASRAGTAAPGPLGRRPLSTAVLHGWPDSKETAVVASGGALGRVRLSDGKLLAVTEHAYPRGGECHAIALGKSFGFVCSEQRGSTAVFAFEPPLSLRAVLSFDEPRFVGASGNGAVVVRGGCTATAPRAGSTRYCLRGTDGALRELLVSGDIGVERVVALRDGSTAVLIPPRLGAAGVLTLIARDGSARSVRLKLPKPDGTGTLTLLRKGLWLESFQERPSGEIAGWVAASGPYVGVRVARDGTVKVGKLEEDIDRSIVSGPFALALGRGAMAAETTDGGFHWKEIELPTELGGGAAKRDTSGVRERGCSPIGCAFGAWLRVGWQGSREQDAAPMAVDAPPPTVMPSASGDRWRLTCTPTGEKAGSPPRPPRRVALPVSEAPSYPGYYPGGYHGGYGYGYGYGLSAENVQTTAWEPLLDVPAPARGRADVGLDRAVDSTPWLLHAYAWGGRAAEWDRAGSFVLRAADPFAVNGSVWSTRTGRSPWSDVVIAAQAFGQDPSMGWSAWSAALDPGGRSGVLVVNSRGTSEVFGFAEGQPVAKIADATNWGLSQVSAAALVAGSWWISAPTGGRSVRVHVIEGERMTRVHDLAGRADANPTQIVRTTDGRSAGLWVREVRLRGAQSSWYVLPLEGDGSSAGEPLLLDAEILGRTPPPCGPDDEGWILVGEPPVAPYLDLVGESPVFDPGRVVARIIASENGLCLDALHARRQAETPPRIAGRLERGAALAGVSVPLVLAQSDADSRRWGFRCTR